jgi:hypothetical protein
MSPAMVAAAAVTGTLTDVRRLLPRDTVIPASPAGIPASRTVIPAQAGIQEP